MAEEKRKRSTAEKIALATNTAGAIAGPAAIYQATQNARRNDGGMPRQVAMDMTNPDTKIGARLVRTRAGARARKIATSLNNPSNKWVKGTAVGLGTLSVALQGANWAGDTIAARMISQKNKEAPVTKRYDENGYASFSETSTRRGTGIGHNIAKAGNYDDLDAYNNDRIRRSGRGEAIGYGSAAALGAGGAGSLAYSAKGTGAKKAAKQWWTAVKPKGAPRRYAAGGLAALAAAPAVHAGTRRFSRESQEDWR